MEKAILNVDVLNISQGMNDNFSHNGDLAIDITSLKYLKAPFTGKIMRIYENCNAVWLESIEPVEYSDGTIDYMTIMTLHDNDISNIKVGQIVKQGDVYYNPGIKGYVTGPHIHVSVGRGKFTGNGWYKNNYGYWCINNQYDITKALFLHSDVQIVSSPYQWKSAIYYETVVQKKSIEELAYEVIKGLWGNNPERKKRLTDAGYNYSEVQALVNKILSPTGTKCYVVEKGDYLIKIGKKLNKDWKTIAKDNNIKFPYIIYPGQKLIIN